MFDLPDPTLVLRNTTKAAQVIGPRWPENEEPSMTDEPNKTRNQGTPQSDTENQGSAQRNPSGEDVNRKNPGQDRDLETDQQQNRNQGERKAS
jgi:hypothetical protein